MSKSSIEWAELSGIRAYRSYLLMKLKKQRISNTNRQNVELEVALRLVEDRIKNLETSGE